MTEAKKQRLHLLDEIRGFAVLCMLVYHFLFSFAEVFGNKTAALLFDFFTPAQPWFAGLFILICGVSCRLSSDNLRRGLKLAGVALGINAVTWPVSLVEPALLIVFGILHLLAAGILSYAWLGKRADRVPLRVLLPVLVLLFCFSLPVERGMLGFGPLTVRLPDALRNVPFFFVLGMYPPEFYSADYFPLLPWIFLFWIGASAGKCVESEKIRRVLSVRILPPLSFLGRYALWFYLLHQPVIMGVLWLIDRAI